MFNGGFWPTAAIRKNFFEVLFCALSGLRLVVIWDAQSIILGKTLAYTITIVLTLERSCTMTSWMCSRNLEYPSLLRLVLILCVLLESALTLAAERETVPQLRKAPPAQSYIPTSKKISIPRKTFVCNVYLNDVPICYKIKDLLRYMQRVYGKDVRNDFVATMNEFSWGWLEQLADDGKVVGICQGGSGLGAVLNPGPLIGLGAGMFTPTPNGRDELRTGCGHAYDAYQSNSADFTGIPKGVYVHDGDAGSLPPLQPLGADFLKSAQTIVKVATGENCKSTIAAAVASSGGRNTDWSGLAEDLYDAAKKGLSGDINGGLLKPVLKGWWMGIDALGHQTQRAEGAGIYFSADGTIDDCRGDKHCEIGYRNTERVMGEKEPPKDETQEETPPENGQDGTEPAGSDSGEDPADNLAQCADGPCQWCDTKQQRIDECEQIEWNSNSCRQYLWVLEGCPDPSLIYPDPEQGFVCNRVLTRQEQQARAMAVDCFQKRQIIRCPPDEPCECDGRSRRSVDSHLKEWNKRICWAVRGGNFPGCPGHIGPQSVPDTPELPGAGGPSTPF